MNLKKTAIGVLTASLITSSAIPTTQAWGFGDIFGKKPEGQEQHMKLGKGDRFDKRMPMSVETQQLFDELKAARETGDEAKVEELREKLKVQHETEEATRQAELDTAMAGGYEAWHAFAVEKQMPAEMIEKITSENFPVFVEIQQTRKKLRELEDKLGIEGAGPQHFFIKR